MNTQEALELMNNKYPTHYCAQKDMTIRWRSCEPTYCTVLEYDTWEGYPEDLGVEEAFRRVVLMECNHNAIMKVNELMIAGDPRMLRALIECQRLNHEGFQQAILGWDFERNEPRILVYLT